MENNRPKKHMEDYARGKQIINSIMAKNAAIDTLSRKQHSALAYLCKVRHEMHCNPNSWFVTADPKYCRFRNLIGHDGKGIINTILKESGLPTIDYKQDVYQVPTDIGIKREDYLSDYAYEKAKAEAFDQSIQIAESLNKAIENYLGQIDKDYGTHYKPKGKNRPTIIPEVEKLDSRYDQKSDGYERPERLFVDMDGTLARFNPVSTLEDLLEKGYYKNLPPQINVVNAIKKLIKEKKFEVYILSAVLTDSPTAVQEKDEWLDQYLPELDRSHRLYCPCGMNKGEAVPGHLKSTDFLLDDYTTNLNSWEPPAKGVKLINDINSTKGTWQGDKIHYLRDASDIADSITKLIIDGEHIYDVRDTTSLALVVQDMRSSLGEAVLSGEKTKQLISEYIEAANSEGYTNLAIVMQKKQHDSYMKTNPRAILATAISYYEKQVFQDHKNEIYPEEIDYDYTQFFSDKSNNNLDI